MTSPKPKPILFPGSAAWPHQGLQKGEIYCHMAKPPKQLPPEVLEEIEIRTYAILNRRGTKDLNSTQLWRRESLVFETPYLMLVIMGSQTVVRVCDRVRHPDGIMLYKEAWWKTKATNEVRHHYDRALTALQHLRDLMVLDDLASL